MRPGTFRARKQIDASSFDRVRRGVFTNSLVNVAKGLVMGAADVVPGVSGGTMALLLGIYDRLVGQIALLSSGAGRLLRGRPKQAVAMARGADWLFLVSLGCGIAVAIGGLVEVVRMLITEQPVLLSAAFFGLVAATVVTTRREVSRWDARLVVVFVAVAVAVFFVLGIRSGSVAEPSSAVVLGAGALAICAMILPGISGAFVLLLLGLYDPITEAVSDRRLGTIALFGLGAATGLGLFSRLLERLLARSRDLVVAMLMGLMAGSLRVLWPWPADTEDVASFANAALGAPPASDLASAIAVATVAAAVAAGLHRLGARRRPA